jgi:hypothetical protein
MLILLPDTAKEGKNPSTGGGMKRAKRKGDGKEKKSLLHEPAFQELLKDLRSQTPEQRERLKKYLDALIDKEGTDHGKEEDAAD